MKRKSSDPTLLKGTHEKVSLTSCIFSSSSTPSKKGSLTDSLFESDSSNETSLSTLKPSPLLRDSKSVSKTNSILFDNSAQQNFRNAVEENRKKNAASYSKSTAPKEQMGPPQIKAGDPILTKMEKKIILNMRKRRSHDEEALKVSKLINVDLSDIGQDEGTSQMLEEDIQGASIVLSHIIRQMGVGTISSSPCIDTSTNKQVRLFPSEILDELTNEAKLIQKEICARLDELGIHFLNSLKNIPENDGTAKNISCEIFRFYEIASRCRGRLDVRYKTSSPPFTDPCIVSNPILLPTVHNLLGSDAELLYSGLIYSFPNSSDQPWHMDGTTLFPELKESLKDRGLADLPPYALNIFIPLENDITTDIGPTEFFPESHISSKAMEIDDDLLKLHSMGTNKNINEQNVKDVENITNRHNVIAPLLKKGDALIYDYRVCHRGTANLSPKGDVRIMLYLMYARPWFREHLNFGTDRLFPN